MLVYYAPNKVVSPAPFPMDVAGTTAAAVSNIEAMLASVGWSRTSGGSYATATFNFPFGLPGLSYGAWSCSIDGIAFCTASGGIPGAWSLSDGLVTVFLGSDAGDDAYAATVFAAAVTANSIWNATPAMGGGGDPGNFALDLTAKAIGPAANNSVLGYNAANCTVGQPPGGGANQWISAGSPCGSQLAVSLAPVVDLGLGALQIVTLYPGGRTYTWLLACCASWNFWADDFSLALWITPGASTEGTGNHTFYYAGVPRNCQVSWGMPPPGGVSSAFTHWDPQQQLVANFNPGVAELDGYFYNPPGTQNFAVAAPMPAPTYNAVELDAKSAVDPVVAIGVPIVLPARIGLPWPGGYGGAPTFYVVGWLYDAMVLTAQYALNSTVEYDGYVWVCLLSQPGASMFVCTPTATASASTAIPWLDECGAGGAPSAGGSGGAVNNYAF